MDQDDDQNLSWPIGTGWPAGGFNIPVNSSGGLGPLNIQPSSSNIKISLTGGSVKTQIKYIVVPNSGPCLELNEQQSITPREMIGLTKFINSVGMVCATTNVDMAWSQLIVSLGIQRHFTSGKAHPTNYDINNDTLYIMLFD